MKLERIIKLKQASLKHELERELRSMGYKCIVNEDGFLFAEGSHPVMLIAHLDTVHTSPVKTICKSEDGNIWMSPEGIGGDDRCGVYMVLETAKQINCSVLFCEDEEIGGLGAKAFVKSGIIPNANYLVEFDRKGYNDAVFYDCDNSEFVNFVEKFGFKENYGSFSDISVVAPALGVAAVNLSSGYYNAHTRYEYIALDEMEDNIQRAVEMINTETDKFVYIEKEWKSYRTRIASYSDYGLKKVSSTERSSIYNYSNKDYDLDEWSDYQFMSYYNGNANNYSEEYDDTDCVIWEEDLSEFRGAVCSFEGDVLESAFDGTFYLDADGCVYQESVDGEVMLLLDGFYPYLSDGVTTGFDKYRAEKKLCMYEDEYYAYMYGESEVV